MLQIFQISDTHLGMASEKRIAEAMCLADTADIIIHCGDYCGGRHGALSVKTTAALMRGLFPDTPILTVLGNHDYWGTRSQAGFDFAYGEILEAFDKHNIHLLDTDGPYVTECGVLFAGHTGWYSNESVRTLVNDTNFLPSHMEGLPVHEYLRRISDDAAIDTIMESNLFEVNTKVWVSHFGVINADKVYGGNVKLGHLAQQAKFTVFLEGHEHVRKTGPLVYQSGSDYGKPQGQTVIV